MIKVTKDVNAVPLSLMPAYLDLFLGRARVPIKSRNTHEKRMLVINAQAYNDTAAFNDRYKEDEIKRALIELYKSKCAFCEQRVEQYHIEHYRPKKIYYWLAFSWDNLILSCPTCNQNKGINFRLQGVQVTFNNVESNIRTINVSSAGYDIIELPDMVNPEVTDPLGRIEFDSNGSINSVDSRFDYTIRTCKIDRKDLNDNRRHLLKIFKDHIRAALYEHTDPQEQKIAVNTVIRNFIIDSKNTHLEFLAFRRYAINTDWLSDIIKELN